MKRLITAVLLLSFCIGLSLYLNTRLNRELNSTKQVIKEIKLFCENKQYKKAADMSSSLVNDWSEQTLLNTTALKKENTEEIEKNINEIHTLLLNGDYKNASELCASTVAEIDYLLHTERVNIENIF